MAWCTWHPDQWKPSSKGHHSNHVDISSIITSPQRPKSGREGVVSSEHHLWKMAQTQLKRKGHPKSTRLTTQCTKTYHSLTTMAMSKGAYQAMETWRTTYPKYSKEPAECVCSCTRNTKVLLDNQTDRVSSQETSIHIKKSPRCKTHMLGCESSHRYSLDGWNRCPSLCHGHKVKTLWLWDMDNMDGVSKWYGYCSNLRVE